MITSIHAKYFANELTLKKAYGKEEKITESLFDSVLHVNPHQIDASLFAFRSPLSKGVILADEVGLGKTIEAGLVMSQFYAESKKRQIVVCPSSLRKQWSMELREKFNLDSIILEKKEMDRREKEHDKNPFQENKIIIISYHFASRIYDILMNQYFDLVIIDEAHKLRNVYKKRNKMSNNIKLAFDGKKKLLLTATPLQNNLLELYGLTTLISEHIFGDEKSFREQYIKENSIEDLKERINFFCKRTLRKDVLEYVKYTNRKAILKEFEPSLNEQKLYDGVSKLLLREDSYSIPKAQKKLTTLMIRKLLASSTYAVKQTLETIKIRLESLYRDEIQYYQVNDLLDEDEQILSDEMLEEDFDIQDSNELNELMINKDNLKKEITELDCLIKLSSNISTDSKSYSLLEALKIGFTKMKETGAHKKALIFTESRRTQDYLKSFLESNGFKNKICIFNGTNSSKETNEIYKSWLEKNKNSGRISDSISADKRNAIIEYFKNEAEIMIATESASEGVNLQFCSLVVNYDMPWNPQRIEQRIGRCHRYGQKNDVVVINFVNKQNYADQRVYELLKEKFKLFDGVFGTSDEVLGSLESGVDFEKEILNIYQSCRTNKEIDEAFEKLQKSMEKEINKSMKRVEKEIFENFDQSVRDKLTNTLSGHLDRYGRMFWRLTKYTLDDKAIFNDEKKEFILNKHINNLRLGPYQMVNKEKTEEEYDGIIYRISHPLGKYVINKNISLPKQECKLVLDITNYNGGKLSNVEQLKSKKGIMMAIKLNISSFDEEEEIVLIGFDSNGNKIEENTLKSMFECEGILCENSLLTDIDKENLQKTINELISEKINLAKLRNVDFIKEEEIRLSRWTEDKILSLENELDNIKKSIRQIQNDLLKATTNEEQLNLNEKLILLNKKKRNMREQIDVNEEKIEKMRLNLISQIKEKATLTTLQEELFKISWEVI